MTLETNTSLTTYGLCTQEQQIKKIVWVEATRMKYRGTSNQEQTEKPLEISDELFKKLTEEQGYVINSKTATFDPENPPKYIWFNHDKRYYLLDFESIHACYFKYRLGIFLLNLDGEPNLAQEVLECRISMSKIVPILRNYGFAKIDYHSCINICYYDVEKGNKDICYNDGTGDKQAVHITKGKLKRQYICSQTMHLLNYLEHDTAQLLFDDLLKLEDHRDLWTTIYQYLKDFGETFAFPHEDYYKALGHWIETERKHMEDPNHTEAPLCKIIFDIIAYHKAFHKKYHYWLLAHYNPEPAPRLYLSKRALDRKQAILAQTKDNRLTLLKD